jgi:mRNA interferase RelE/StbE
MSKYAIEVSATAEKQLRKLDSPALGCIVKSIKELASDPRPRGCKKFHGYEDVYRIRTGNFRIIYSVEDRKLLIIILKVRHRKAIYR